MKGNIFIGTVLLSSAIYSSSVISHCRQVKVKSAPPIEVRISNFFDEVVYSGITTEPSRFGTQGTFTCTTPTNVENQIVLTSPLQNRSVLLGFDGGKYVFEVQLTNYKYHNLQTIGGFVGLRPYQIGQYDAPVELTLKTVERGVTSNDIYIQSATNVLTLPSIITVADATEISPVLIEQEEVNRLTSYTHEGGWLTKSYDMYYQPVRFTHQPKVTTCLFRDRLRWLTLNNTTMAELKRGNKVGYQLFNLEFYCGAPHMTREALDRSLKIFMSSDHLLDSDDTVLLNNKTVQGSANDIGIGFRLESIDLGGKLVKFSREGIKQGDATTLYSMKANEYFPTYFYLRMAAYYHVYNQARLRPGYLLSSITAVMVYE